MHPGQHRDRAPCIHRHHERRGEIQSKVHLAARDRVRLPSGCLGHDIADLGETLCTQQLLGDILGRDADAPDLCKADAGRFRRRLCGERLLDPNEARGAGCRKAGQEAPAALDDLHVHVSPREKWDQVFNSRFSSSRKRQSVPSAMICLRARFDHARLLHAQRVEAQRGFGIVFPPAVVPGVLQRLQRDSHSYGTKSRSTSCRASIAGSDAQRSAPLRMARRTRLVATGYLFT